MMIEEEQSGCKCVIRMSGKTTTLVDPAAFEAVSQVSALLATLVVLLALFFCDSSIVLPTVIKERTYQAWRRKHQHGCMEPRFSFRLQLLVI
jgi:hypothetical protein